MTEPTEVDPSGDLTLQVGVGEHRKAFIVSSKAMSLASHVWCKMLDPTRLCEKKRVDLLDDDPDALLILLRISHLQFSNVPLHVEYTLLVHLAVLCDKYEMAQILLPWITPWQADWMPHSLRRGYENLLFVAWVFSDLETYNAIARQWVMKSTLDIDGNLVMDTNVLKHKIMPPEALEAIAEARNKRIQAILDKCYELIDHYSTASTGNGNCRAVRHSDGFDEFACDALMLGCMAKGLTDIGLLPGRITSGSIVKSVDALRIEVGNIAIATVPDHGNCNCLVDLTDGLIILSSKTEPSGVLELHKKQMEEQRIEHSAYAECSCLQKVSPTFRQLHSSQGFAMSAFDGRY